MTDHPRVLVLLRHAKSAYPDGVVDHDRPLAPRGERQAGLAGDWLQANVPAFELVLCSTATRARQTLARAGIEAPVHYAERLYGASAATVIDQISTVADDVKTLLIVGHEPTMSEVALALAGNGSNAAAIERVSEKYPTSALAVLRLCCRWNRIKPGGAALVDFHVPR